MPIPSVETESSPQRLDAPQLTAYTRSEYIRRLLWTVVQGTLFRFSPARMIRWRLFLLRLFGAKAGRSEIHPTAKILHPWLLTVGEWSNLGPRVIVYNLGPIHIGSHTLISQDVYLCGGTHDYHQASLPLVRPSITIGDGVWIAAQAFIGPGVTVANGSVVGARSMVARDIPANVVAAGNPCRVLKPRDMTATTK